MLASDEAARISQLPRGGKYVLIAMGVNLGSLRKKFSQLGILKGLNYKQIVAAVGKGANSIQHVSDGSVRVWVSMDYRITLLFDADEVCLGVSNETSTF
jgi:hypothetical protein